MARHVCVPGQAITVQSKGVTLLRWAGPVYSDCLLKYRYRHFRICLPATHSAAGVQIRSVLIGGCERPVLSDGSTIRASLTKETCATWTSLLK